MYLDGRFKYGQEDAYPELRHSCLILKASILVSGRRTHWIPQKGWVPFLLQTACQSRRLRLPGGTQNPPCQVWGRGSCHTAGADSDYTGIGVTVQIDGTAFRGPNRHKDATHLGGRVVDSRRQQDGQKKGATAEPLHNSTYVIKNLII